MNSKDTEYEEVSSANVEVPLIRSLPVTEEYRPATFDEIVGQDEHIELVKGYIDLGVWQFPHLMLYGPPGTGKSSTARLIAFELRRLYRSPLYEYNASHDNKIEFVRNVINKLVKSAVLASDGKYWGETVESRRIIILGEADRLTVEAQAALKETLENSNTLETTIFIFTCNNFEAMDKALVSRCVTMNFGVLSDEHLVQIAKKVSTAMDLKIAESRYWRIARESKGDARELLKILQHYSIRKVLPNQSGLDFELEQRIKAFTEYVGRHRLVVESKLTTNFAWARGAQGLVNLRVIALKCIQRKKVLCIGFHAMNKKIAYAYTLYDKNLNDESGPALLKEYGFKFTDSEIVEPPILEVKPRRSSSKKGTKSL